MSAYADCPRCGTHLIWARLPSGKKLPLNRDPDPQGLAAAMQTTTLTWHARIAIPGERLAPPWKRYAIHDASCAEPTATPEPPRNVTQLTTWKRARAAHVDRTEHQVKLLRAAKTESEALF